LPRRNLTKDKGGKRPITTLLQPPMGFKGMIIGKEDLLVTTGL
jgi:hypothetical protein